MNDSMIAASQELLACAPFNHDLDVWLRTGGWPLKRVIYAWFNPSTQDDKITCMSRAHQLASWCHYGFNVFNLTESFCASLLLTDVERSPPMLPFPCFSITLPADFIAAEIPGQTIKRVFVHRCADIQRKIHYQLSVEALLIFTEYTDDRWSQRVYSWPHGLDKELDQPDGSRTEPLTNTEGSLLIRLVRGLCSFLEAKIEPLELDNAKAVERAKWTKKPTPRVFTVGRTVKLSQELRRAAQVVVAGEADPLWKLQNRHVVRGHWRWQPIGHRLPEGVEGPQNAKKTWIEPYWKGPEGAEAWRHVYEVGSST